MGTESQEELDATSKEESVADLILDAGYQNLSLQFDHMKSVVDSVIKHLVIGRCR